MVDGTECIWNLIWRNLFVRQLLWFHWYGSITLIRWQWSPVNGLPLWSAWWLSPLEWQVITLNRRQWLSVKTCTYFLVFWWNYDNNSAGRVSVCTTHWCEHYEITNRHLAYSMTGHITSEGCYRYCLCFSYTGFKVFCPCQYFWSFILRMSLLVSSSYDQKSPCKIMLILLSILTFSHDRLK